MSRVIVFSADLAATRDAAPPSVGLRWATPSDGAALARLGWPETFVAQLMSSGTRIAVAEEAGRLVGFNAYEFDQKFRQFHWLMLHPRTGEDVVAFGGFVTPERRGEGILASIKGFAADRFITEGRCRMISCCLADNKPSIKAHKRAGAVRLKTLTRIRIRKLSLIFDGPWPCHATWGDKYPFDLKL